MARVIKLSLACALVAFGLQLGTATAGDFSVTEFTIDENALCDIRDAWIDDMLRKHPEGTWAEMKYELSNDDLARLGLPSKEVLTSLDTSKPTLVTRDGRSFGVPLSDLEAAMGTQTEPSLVTFAGTGCFGIRPGAFYLIESGNSISLCSLAHLYGSAISTAGHCGKTGDTATVIAATGNRADITGAILLDFGTFGASHDNGLGDDYALINIDPAYSALVTPTMCFWGGPRGVYQAEGDVAALGWKGNSGPSLSVNPDPMLAQTIVHYGHGVGVGAGGTPRVGEAIAWRPDHFMFTGAIAPGDSGSGANTLLGDAVGANMQAAGIITHIWVDALMRDGIGIMGGTRASKVGTATDGQIVPYPLPIAGLP